MGKKCTVSIAMPVRNCERTIVAAIRSIVFQSFLDWELLVIDDGSSDGTLAILRQFNDPRIRIYSDGQSRGLPNRLNEAIVKANGQYFARMDGDDVSYPRRLDEQVAYLRARPDIDLVGAGMMIFDDQGVVVGKRIPPVSHELICRRPYSGFPVAHPSYCGRLEWFQIHGYSETATRCEDQDLLLRSYQTSRFGNVPNILLGYREGALDLKKIIRSRYYFSQRIWLQARKASEPISGLRGFLEQYVKGAIDTIAVSAGLQRVLLRHRARPATNDEIETWKQVWYSLNIPRN